MSQSPYERAFDEDARLDDASSSECPECGGRIWTSVRETVCGDCGLVVDQQRIDRGPEWHQTDTPEEDPRRTGAPLAAARHDRGLSTEIGRDRTDANGNPIDAAKQRRLARLRRQHSHARCRSKRERNEMHAMIEIGRLAAILELGEDLQEQASQLFRAAHTADLLRGRSIEAVSAGVVYAACRCRGLPQTLSDVGPAARVSETRVKRAYAMLNRELDLAARPRKPEAFLPRFVSALELSSRVERRARDFLDAGNMSAESGANPASVAGGAVLIAAADVGEQGEFRQSELAEVASVTPVTLRRYRDELRMQP